MSAAAIALFSVSGVAGIATAAFASQCGWRCFSPRGAELWLARVGTQPALTQICSYLVAILPLLALGSLFGAAAVTAASDAAARRLVVSLSLAGAASFCAALAAARWRAAAWRPSSGNERLGWLALAFFVGSVLALALLAEPPTFLGLGACFLGLQVLAVAGAPPRDADAGAPLLAELAQLLELQAAEDDASEQRGAARALNALGLALRRARGEAAPAAATASDTVRRLATEDATRRRCARVACAGAYILAHLAFLLYQPAAAGLRAAFHLFCIF